MSASYSKEYLGLFEVSTKSDSLNLRSKASKSGGVLTTMPKGSFVFGKGVTDSGFLLCEFLSTKTDVAGYANIKYLKKVSV